MGRVVATEQRKVIVGQWEASLGRPHFRCSLCDNGFPEGSEYVSVLLLDEAAALQRIDACTKCAAVHEARAFAFWRAKVTRSDERRKKQLDINFLVDFFRRLTAPEAPHQGDITYIIALVLLRKKILVQPRGERDPEKLVVRFSNEPDGPLHRLPIPELTPEKMAAIKDDLTRIFNLEEGGAATDLSAPRPPAADESSRVAGSAEGSAG